MSTAAFYTKLDVGRRVIYSTLVSWFSKTKTIHFDEIHSSPANTSHRQRSDSHWISDREEHHFPLRTFQFIDKVKDSVDGSTDGVVTNTSTCHERINNIHS